MLALSASTATSLLGMTCAATPTVATSTAAAVPRRATRGKAADFGAVRTAVLPTLPPMTECRILWAVISAETRPLMAAATASASSVERCGRHQVDAAETRGVEAGEKNEVLAAKTLSL